VVQTGELRPDELNVELYYGKMRHLDRIDTPRVKMMRVKEEREPWQLPLSAVSCHAAIQADTGSRFG
jgi:hypothetical protein